MSDGDTIIRASSLTSWPDCNRRGAARLIPLELAAAGYAVRQTFSGIGAIIGSGTHAGLAYTLKAKMATGELGKLEAAKEATIDEMRKRVAEEGVVYDDMSPEMNTGEKQALRMVAIYRQTVAQDIVPVAVEVRLTANIAPGFVLSGQADLAEDDTVEDHKTGVRRRSNTAQYGAYALLRRSHDETVNRLIERYIPRVPLAKAQPEPKRVLYDPAVAETMAWGTLKRMMRDVAAFREGGDIEAFEANPASALCSAKYCPLWRTNGCRYARPD